MGRSGNDESNERSMEIKSHSDHQVTLLSPDSVSPHFCLNKISLGCQCLVPVL